ncbi:emerin isoform X1 [Pleurodeles waltl]|uniref:emerin isoform X1 n=1 Tax=Pleurodeles waltl TaxID=8319 RepID=UPI0037098714
MEQFKGMTDEELISALKKYSIPHGPVVGTTRKLYEKKIYEYETQRTKHSPSKQTYTYSDSDSPLYESKRYDVLSREGRSGGSPAYQLDGRAGTAPGQILFTSQTPNPPLDEALIDAYTPGHMFVDDGPGRSGHSGQRTTVRLIVPTTTPPTPVATTSQPTKCPPTRVPSTVATILCPPVLDPVGQITNPDTEGPGPHGRGHPVPRAQTRGSRVSGRDAVCQQSEATVPIHSKDTIREVLGVHQESQGMMGQLLAELGEIKQLQRDMHRDMLQQMEAHNANTASLTGVLRDIQTTLGRAFPPPSSSACGATKSSPSKSAAATGSKALPEYHPPSDTPASAAAGSPRPRKLGRPSKNRGAVDGKTPTTAS